MLFEQLQQKAKDLPNRLLSLYKKSQNHCLSFFTLLLSSNDSAIDDANTIATLACSLDEEYDKPLCDYLDTHPENLGRDLQTFKKQVLIGIYLIKWFQYNSVIFNNRANSLLSLFREDMEVSTLEELDENEYKLCLRSLSYYCSFVYHNKDVGLNSALDVGLGPEIQLDIHNARIMLFSNSSLSYRGFYEMLFP
jgi:hypothetical protein